MKKILITLISATCILGGISQAGNYTVEQQDAYDYAYSQKITTISSIEKADMNGSLTRIAMAKMVSNFAINVLGLQPDTSKNCSFSDVPQTLDADYNYGVTQACQLGLMGMGSNGKKSDKFNPYGTVTRGQFGTAFSRALSKANGSVVADGNPYYSTHLSYLYTKGIIKNVSTPLSSAVEKRGNVMIMMNRASNNVNQENNNGKILNKEIVNYDGLLGVEILDSGIYNQLKIKITNKTKSNIQIDGIHLAGVTMDNAIGVYQGDNTMQPDLLRRNQDNTIDADFWYPAVLSQGGSTTLSVWAEKNGSSAVLDSILFNINGKVYVFSKDTSVSTEWNKLFVKNDGTNKNGTEKKYYNNGQLHEILNYKNGKLNGEYREYYYNGKLSKKGQYEDDIKTGERVEYFEDGEIKSKGSYKNGELDGYWIRYCEKGNTQCTSLDGNYKNGNLVVDGDEKKVVDVSSYVTLGKGEASRNTDITLVVNNKSSGKIRITGIKLGNFKKDECASVFFGDNTMDSILRDGYDTASVEFPYPIDVERNGSTSLVVRANMIGTKVTIDAIVFSVEEEDFKTNYVVGKSNTSAANWKELYAEKYITSYVTLAKGEATRDTDLKLVINNKSLGKIRITGIELGNFKKDECASVFFGDNTMDSILRDEGDTASIRFPYPIDVERNGLTSLVVRADMDGTKVTVDAIEFAIEEENFRAYYEVSKQDTSVAKWEELYAEK